MTFRKSEARELRQRDAEARRVEPLPALPPAVGRPRAGREALPRGGAAVRPEGVRGLRREAGGGSGRRAGPPEGEHTPRRHVPGAAFTF